MDIRDIIVKIQFDGKDSRPVFARMDSPDIREARPEE
jgi:hypothetical protein